MITVLSFGLIGLTLDIIGFIGIFFAKPKPLNKIPNLNIYRNATLGDSSTRTDINYITNSINKAFDSFNDGNVKNEISSKKYFKLVVWGFIFQFIGLLINLFITCDAYSYIIHKF